MTRSFSANLALAAMALASLSMSSAFAGERHHTRDDNSTRIERYYGLVEQNASAAPRRHAYGDAFPVYGVGSDSPVTDQ